MNRTQIGTLLVAATLVLAGCAGGIGGGTSASGTNDDGGTAATSEQATMHFYVSDRPGAIEEFEHLNVTVTSVTLYEKTDGADDGADANGSDADDDVDGNDSDVDADVDAEAEVDADNASVDAGANASAGMDAGENEDESEDDGDLEKTTYDVEETTLDLTQLRGANASLVDTMNVSAGTYERVVLHVSETNGTLTDGTQVNVKLPSEKLRLNKEFTVEAGSDTAFVFDVMVHKAGNSGKYVLRPVVGESGTGDEVEIDDVAGGAVPTTNGSAAVEVGDDEGDEDETTTETPSEDESDSESETTTATETATDGGEAATADDLTLQFGGELRANASAALMVTDDGGAVEGATVTVNGEVVGTTDANGQLSFQVPQSDDVTVVVEKGEAEVEYEAEL